MSNQPLPRDLENCEGCKADRVWTTTSRLADRKALLRNGFTYPRPHTCEETAVSADRWMVVDRNRTPIFPGMFSRDNAQGEADRLNEEGLADFRPYRVVRDAVAEDQS